LGKRDVDIIGRLFTSGKPGIYIHKQSLGLLAAYSGGHWPGKIAKL
jgi:hypothetical protein